MASYFSSSLYRLVCTREIHSDSDFRVSLQKNFSTVIYSSISSSARSRQGEGGHVKSHVDFPYGPVFNLEYSPEGKQLLAARANKALTVHDSLSGKQVHVVPNAHNDCVNIITFIGNSWTIATGSDDHSIRLWDIRRLTTPTAVLSRHTGWVKNIEYDSTNDLLFSIAFHDGVRKWNLNNLASYDPQDSTYSHNCADAVADNLVLKHNNAVRMRISQDNSKMIVTLRQNGLFVVSNFDGSAIETARQAFQAVLQQADNVHLSDKQTKKISKNALLSRNMPSLHFLSQPQQNKYRSTLSATFHPMSSSLVALRVMDIEHSSVLQELTVLYESSLGGDYSALTQFSDDVVASNFLKYCDESSPDESLDFIKEFSFSPDGKILASPYEYGVRLLAVDTACTSMDDYYDRRFSSREKDLSSMEFESIANVSPGHAAAVLTCRMNYDYSLASGCMDGNVLVSQPKL